MGSFNQVVFQEAVAGFDEAGVLSFKHAGLTLCPRNPCIFCDGGLSAKTLDVANLGDDAGGLKRTSGAWGTGLS